MARQRVLPKIIHKRKMIRQNQYRSRVNFFLQRGFSYTLAEKLAREVRT